MTENFLKVEHIHCTICVLSQIITAVNHN